MFYDGPPIQMNLKIQDLAGEAVDDSSMCFRLIPCKK